MGWDARGFASRGTRTMLKFSCWNSVPPRLMLRRWTLIRSRCFHSAFCCKKFVEFACFCVLRIWLIGFLLCRRYSQVPKTCWTIFWSVLHFIKELTWCTWDYSRNYNEKLMGVRGYHYLISHKRRFSNSTSSVHVTLRDGGVLFLVRNTGPNLSPIELFLMWLVHVLKNTLWKRCLLCLLC